VYHGAWCADAGEPVAPHGALARHYAADAANQATAAGMRVIGALASRTDGDMERYLRDARPLELADGGPEMDRDMIAKSFDL
jgi:alkylation response protein AidB-like acyl-CoA dehydrogenase